MLTPKDQDLIIQYAKKYKVSTIILFGSSLRDDPEAEDIDLGVKGVEPGMFFQFYGELYMNLSKPVDLVDLSHKSLFNDYIERTGLKIYEKAA